MPSWRGAAHVRNLSSTGLRWAYRMQAFGAHHIGTSGRVIVLCPSEGVLAGPLLQAISPRPIHVVANAAMIKALPPRVLEATGGLVPVGATAIRAQLSAADALADGRVVAVVGSQVDPAWLVAMSHAPVVCVTLVGEQGRVSTDPPRIGSPIRAYVSAQHRLPTLGDPLRASTRAAVTEKLRQVTTDADDQALRRAGLREAS
jgi:hypothetical protein